MAFAAGPASLLRFPRRLPAALQEDRRVRDDRLVLGSPKLAGRDAEVTEQASKLKFAGPRGVKVERLRTVPSQGGCNEVTTWNFGVANSKNFAKLESGFFRNSQAATAIAAAYRAKAEALSAIAMRRTEPLASS